MLQFQIWMFAAIILLNACRVSIKLEFDRWPNNYYLWLRTFHHKFCSVPFITTDANQVVLFSLFNLWRQYVPLFTTRTQYFHSPVSYFVSHYAGGCLLSFDCKDVKCRFLRNWIFLAMRLGMPRTAQNDFHEGYGRCSSGILANWDQLVENQFLFFMSIVHRVMQFKMKDSVADPGFGQGRGPRNFLRDFADKAKSSEWSKPYNIGRGPGPALGPMEGLAFLTIKYAFFHFSWYFFFNIFNVHLCG